MLVIHIIAVVLMAIDTGEYRIVCRVAMAIYTTVPFIVMFSREYGKKLGVMYSEFSRFPTRPGCMAFHAIHGNISCKMIRVGSIIIIRLMAGDTFRRNIGIIRQVMASVTIKYRVTFSEGKDSVVKPRSTPGKCSHRMAVNTLGGEVT